MRTKRLVITSFLACVFYFAAHDALAFYNPHTGRWLSRDPVGEKGHQSLAKSSAMPIRPDDASPYNFVANNPSQRIDPDGRWWQILLLLLFAGCSPPADCTKIADASRNCHQDALDLDDPAFGYE